MTVLHIAFIEDNPSSGVCGVVPQHIRHQQQMVDVGLVNITNLKIADVKNQFEYKSGFDISELPEPFSKPDIVIFHEVYRVQFIKIASDLRRKGVLYIIIPHGSLTREVQRQRRLKKLVGNVLLFNRFIKGAKAIQCLSENEKSRIDFKKEKFVSATGIDMPQKCKETFSEQTVNMNYIGRLEMYTKGLDIMAKAVAKNAGYLREHNYKINIYGPDILGRKKAVQELISKLGIADILLLNKAVYAEEKEAVLLDTDIFIQTSRTEAITMGILEAMSYGVPCLVTHGTTWGDYIRRYDAGWVAENNIDSVAEEMLKALSEKELWLRKSQNARKLAEENFRWDGIAKETLYNYERYCK